MPDLHVALQNDRSLKAQLLVQFPELEDDERALLDTLDGISDLDQQIVIAMREALVREAMANGVATLIATLGERKTRLTHGADNIRHAVLSVMVDAGRNKIAAPDMTLTASPGRPGVQIIDEALLPVDFVVTTRRADMKAINAAVKEGATIPGTAPKNPKPYLTVRVS